MPRPAPKLSLYLENFTDDNPVDWRYLVHWATAADEAGIDRIALSDHVAFGEQLDDYADPSKGGVEGGKQPTGPDGCWLDPLSTIAYLSALTTRVTFTTRILLAALRRPVTLAKTASTIDVLSGGRLEVGVGVGWQRAEYEAAGISFERRGRILDDSLEICRRLWTQRVASYEGEGVSFDRVHQMPKPVRPEGIPLWISGTANRFAMDRLARFGTGWIPWGRDAADVPAGIRRMRHALAERGRDPDGVEVTSALLVRRDQRDRPDFEATVAPVGQLLEAGVTDICLMFGGRQRGESPGEILDRLSEAVRAIVGGVR
jgi:probable F420-dependent oxidoreductase